MERSKSPTGEAQHQRHDDLQLASACAAGSAAAIAHLELTHLAQTRAHLRRLQMSGDVIDEACQMLRIRMLVGPPPRIASYNGEIPLLEWLRVAAFRIALDLSQASRRHYLLEEIYATSYSFPPPRQVDLDVERDRRLPGVQSALQRALAALPPDGRELLRLYYFEAATIDVIAAIVGIHRGTAARRLLALRAAVLKAMRAEVTGFDDLVEAVAGHLDVQLPVATQLADAEPLPKAS